MPSDIRNFSVHETNVLLESYAFNDLWLNHSNGLTLVCSAPAVLKKHIRGHYALFNKPIELVSIYDLKIVL